MTSKESWDSRKELLKLFAEKKKKKPTTRTMMMTHTHTHTHTHEQIQTQSRLTDSQGQTAEKGKTGRGSRERNLLNFPHP